MPLWADQAPFAGSRMTGIADAIKSGTQTPASPAQDPPPAPALEVTDPAAVEGESVPAIDNVFTSGLTLREVAGERRVQG